MKLIFLIFIILWLNYLSLNFAERIAVFGGSGRTGSECVYQALKSGKKVSVLARDPKKVCIPEGSGGSSAGSLIIDDNLLVVQGDVKNQEDVEKIFDQKISGVIVALGGRTKEVGTTMLTDGTTNIVKAMKKKSVKRIAVITSIGCGDSAQQAPFSFRMLMRTVMKKVIKDKNNQEKLFLEGPGSSLEYCIIRPGGLGTGRPTGVVNVIDGQAGSIHRADVADFCLQAVTNPNFPFIKKTPCISSVGGTGWEKSGEGFDAPTKG
mmetsp:Transcript_4283/g.5548  ORF Transcript_4283/g.5548 Transcript_4283/m.5548 type:complete len:264 (+) Transcript_4283:78-869(+)